MKLWKKVVMIAIACFFLVIGLQQWLSYKRLQTHIGQYAYANIGYALQSIGKNGAYIGQITDVDWNRLPDREKAIQGFQPRYLVAREVVKGTTKERWYCTYLIQTKSVPPKKFKPSPFPPFVDER